jgi:eukaryotic-like serine/threonine-protein kinase
LPDGGTDKKIPMPRGRDSRKSARGFFLVVGGRLRADGRLVVSLAEGAGGRELIKLIDPATGRPSGRPAPHNPGWVVRAIAFSPDGRYFATGSNPPGRVAGEVRLWDATTGRLLLPPMPHTNWAAALAFQPDGKILAAGDYNGLVRFWDTSTGKEAGRPLPQGEIILGLAYSPDGKILAVGLAPDRTAKPGVRLWDTTTRQPVGELLPSAGDEVSRIEFRPDGRTFLGGSWRSARLWDTTLRQGLGKPMIGEAFGGFRPDGRDFLALGRDGAVKLRDATTGEVLSTLMSTSSPAFCAAFRGDGGLVAVGFEDGAVRLCDPAAKQPVGPPRFMRHAVQEVAFTPDGRTVAAIDQVGESRTWPVPRRSWIRASTT